MKLLTVTLGLVLFSATLAFVPRSAEPITASNTELSTADLASAMGLRWWSFDLHFDKPVEEVRIQPCELRRDLHGGWAHVPLAPFEGLGSEEGIQDIDVKFLTSDLPSDDYYLILGGTRGSNHFTARPDFARTYWSTESSKFIDGCLVLATEEKNPNMITGREENMVRVVALEITTDELAPR